jgi:hypothetical protein
MLDVTGEPLGIHARDMRGELQDNVFETAWADNIPVGPSGEGLPDIINDLGTDRWRHDRWRHDRGRHDARSGGGTPIPIPTPDPDPTPDPGPDAGSRSRRPILIPIRRRIPIPIPIRPPIPTPTPIPIPGGGGGPMGPIVPASNVQGCPTPTQYIAEPVATTGDDILDNRIRVNNMTVGGASTNLVNCPGIPGVGHFYANPTYTLDLSDHDDDFWRFQVHTDRLLRHRLCSRMRMETSISTTTVAMAYNARVRLFDMADLNGRINIWVGTYWGNTCDDVDLIIRVWD